MHQVEQIYLETFLSPIRSILSSNDVTDVYINRPQEAWVETTNGNIEKHSLPDLSEGNLVRLAHQIAAYSHQGINRENPLLSATLPDGSRVQVVLPPATRSTCAFAIRKHNTSGMHLDDYNLTGAFGQTVSGLEAKSNEMDAEIAKAQKEGDFKSLLSKCVKSKKNILISGGTSTGKTTFLNALMHEIPSDERLILIEDTPELKLHHQNAVGLLAARNAMGEARITTNDLLSATLRLRPDRIIVGELRGPEAFTFLRAINTGHPGSMTTVHADSPSQAIEQIALLVLQSGSQLKRSDVIEYVRSTVDVYVQLSRINGKRTVSEVRLKNQLS